MKVFISWSGNTSHRIAIILRDWLPSVLQSLQPYVSSEDIDKGTRWSTDISKELAESSYGILCVTKDNLEASWLNFEAGALSKAFDKSKVSPILIGVKRAEIKGPILQFQSTIIDKDDIKKLLHSLNKACDPNSLEEGRLDGIFEVWWPKLKEQLDLVLQAFKSEEKNLPEEKRTKQSINNDIIEEILELVRSQQKILTNPENFLPADYLRYILRDNIGTPFSLELLDELMSSYFELRDFVRNCNELEDIKMELLSRVDRLGQPIHIIMRNVSKKSKYRSKGLME